jgi:hypothetical protein
MSAKSAANQGQWISREVLYWHSHEQQHHLPSLGPARERKGRHHEDTLKGLSASSVQYLLDAQAEDTYQISHRMGIGAAGGEAHLVKKDPLLSLHKSVCEGIECSAIVALLWFDAFRTSQARCFPPSLIKPNRLFRLSSENSAAFLASPRLLTLSSTVNARTVSSRRYSP